MLTISYDVLKALVELRAHEIEQEARTRHVAYARERDHPGWF
jgi:hypothetical protein